MVVPFRVIAHRGASAHAPENSLPAFEMSAAMGALEVELDVRLSADDEIMVFHDDKLDRTTARTGRVRHYEAAILRCTDIGDWFDRMHPESEVSYAGTMIACLDDVFETIGKRVHYHIEIKGWEDWLPLRLLERVDRYGLRDHITVTSFSMRPLLQIRAISKETPICFLLREAADAMRSAEFRPALEGLGSGEVFDYWIDAAAEADFQQVGIRAKDVLRRTIARATDRGLEVRGWGVGSESDLAHLVRIGAAGATVDWPERAIEIVNRMERAAGQGALG